MTAGEGIGANQHDRPRRGDVERVTYAHGMAHEDILLQLRHVLAGDDAIFECPETGCDAVGDGTLFEQLLHGVGGPLDAPDGMFTQQDLGFAGCAMGHGHDLVEGERFPIQDD